MEELLFLSFPLLILLAVYITFYKLQNLPPSPFPTLPILGHLHLIKKPYIQTLTSLSTRHGKILLLWFGIRRVLVVSSHSAAKECLTKNDVIFANRPKLHAGKILGYNYSDLTWASYGDQWRSLRRISSTELLSSFRLQMLSGVRAGEVRILIRKLFKESDRIVELRSAIFELMFNVMMKMIAGKRYYGDDVANSDEAMRFQQIVEDTSKVLARMNAGDFLPFVRWFGVTTAEERVMVDLQARRNEFMQNLVQQHLDAKVDDEKKNLIQILLSLLEETERSDQSHQTICSLMLIMLTAGTDTTASTIEWAMSYLLNNPKILRKAQNEIINQVGESRFVDETDMANLPYLHCIINETMRLNPVVPLLLPHESSDNCTVEGFEIPRGTMLLVNLPAIQKDASVWDEPKKFKPERFEGFDVIKDGFKFMPFGSGRRRCPGEGLAIRIMMLTLGSLVQCFDWERVSEEMVDLTVGFGLIATKAQPLVAKCKPRRSMVDLLSQI